MPAVYVALGELLVKLVGIAVEYVTATEERRQQLLAEADAEFKKCMSVLQGLDAAIAKNNAEADAAAQRP